MGAVVAETPPAASGPPLEPPPGRLDPAEASGGAGSADDDPPQQQLPMSAAGAGGEGARAPGTRTRSEPGRLSRPGGRRGNLAFPGGAGARGGWAGHEREGREGMAGR